MVESDLLDLCDLDDLVRHFRLFGVKDFDDLLDPVPLDFEEPLPLRCARKADGVILTLDIVVEILGFVDLSELNILLCKCRFGLFKTWSGFCSKRRPAF